MHDETGLSWSMTETPILERELTAILRELEVRGVLKRPELEEPIKAQFTMLPPPSDHRLMRRELSLDLPAGSYLRGFALDWPSRGHPLLVWEWSEPAPPAVPHA